MTCRLCICRGAIDKYWMTHTVGIVLKEIKICTLRWN